MLESGFIISCFGEDGIETTLEDDGVEEEARRAGVGAGHLYQFVLGAITQALGSVAHIPSEMVPVFASPEPAMSPLKKKPTPMHGWMMKYCARPPPTPLPPSRHAPRSALHRAALSAQEQLLHFFFNCFVLFCAGSGMGADWQRRWLLLDQRKGAPNPSAARNWENNRTRVDVHRIRGFSWHTA